MPRLSVSFLSRKARKPSIVAAAGLGLFLSNSSASADDIPVDVELQLLLDVSGSISSSEYDLQMDGYAYSFRENAVQNAILDQSDGSYGSIAVQTIMWSGGTQQTVTSDWTLLDSASSIDAYADSLASMNRPYGGTTYTAEALQFGAAQFQDNGFDGTRKVVDISGDGYGYDYMYGDRWWFSGEQTSAMRDDALASGIDTINGITITHDYAQVGDQDLTTWYTNDVSGGTNAFVIEAASFTDFSTALTTKLTAEIEGGYIPEEAVASNVQGPVSSAPVPGVGAACALFLTLVGFMHARRNKPGEAV